MITVGSTALRLQGLTDRIGDKDVWFPERLQGEVDTTGIDASFVPTNIFRELLIHCVEIDGQVVADPNALLTIKCSHLGWDINWDKHARDAVMLMNKGYRIIPVLYHMLVAFWNEAHRDKSYLSLYQTKEQFFTDNVTYVYDHDFLHELAALPNKPMYSKCLVDGQEVAIDKNKFDQMLFSDQFQMFLEEISVIAAERWLIPTKIHGKIDIGKAYRMAVKKTICSLTKNWATDFLIFNLDKYWGHNYHLIRQILTHIPEGKLFMTEFVTYEDFRDHVASLLGRADESCGNTFNWEITRSGIKEVGLELIEKDGGGEGGAEDCYSVVKLNGVFYCIYYNYYSHHGFDFDYASIQVVRPVEKVITVYE